MIDIKPEINDMIRPDGWTYRERLQEGAEYVDESFIGSAFYLESSKWSNIKYPINVTITSYKGQWKLGAMRYRIKIEWVKDGEESEFSGGFLWKRT